MKFDAVCHLFHPMSDAEIEELVRRHGGIEAGVELDDVGLSELAERLIAEREIDATDEAFMAERDNLSDEELAARIKAAPDMGGAMLVELSKFMRRRQGD